MQEHAFGKRDGQVPLSNNFYVCSRCNNIVSISRTSSHSKKCAPSPHSSPPIVEATGSASFLPSLEEVMSCRCSTLKYIPQRACQAFGEVLSATLRKVMSDNSTEASTLLFMLPKCVLPPGNHGSSSQGKGKSTQIPIEQLCKMWSAGNIQAFWQLAVAAGQSTHRRSPPLLIQLKRQKKTR